VKRRAIPLLAALLLAAVATLTLVAYINGLEQRALADVETVEVFVARDTISQGVSAEAAEAQGLLVRERAPRNLVPATAVVSLDDLSGRVAGTEIHPGEVILRERFVTPAQVGPRLQIPDDMHAMAFEVRVPPGVAGFVQAGDTISILAQLEAPSEEDEDGGQEDSDGPRVQFLLQNVQVLNVGQRVVVTEEGEEQDRIRRHEDRVMVTVALQPVDAEKLAFAVLNGDLWLTLVPEGQEPANTPGRTYDNAFD
jgi:pilus assembly protein CpaB